jgi:hypothetical protein
VQAPEQAWHHFMQHCLDTRQQPQLRACAEVLSKAETELWLDACTTPLACECKPYTLHTFYPSSSTLLYSLLAESPWAHLAAASCRSQMLWCSLLLPALRRPWPWWLQPSHYHQQQPQQWHPQMQRWPGRCGQSGRWWRLQGSKKAQGGRAMEHDIP